MMKKHKPKPDTQRLVGVHIVRLRTDGLKTNDTIHLNTPSGKSNPHKTGTGIWDVELGVALADSEPIGETGFHRVQAALNGGCVFSPEDILE